VWKMAGVDRFLLGRRLETVAVGMQRKGGLEGGGCYVPTPWGAGMRGGGGRRGGGRGRGGTIPRDGKVDQRFLNVLAVEFRSAVN